MIADAPVVLFGADAPSHDYHRAAGDFAASCARLGALRSRGAAIAVETPITRSNYRSLAGFPTQLRALGVQAWRLRVVVDAELDAAVVARTVPRLALALPFALHAATRARQLGVTPSVVGAPRCLLGPLAAWAVPSSARSHPAPCQRCALASACPGIDAGYAARFGADELTPQV